MRPKPMPRWRRTTRVSKNRKASATRVLDHRRTKSSDYPVPLALELEPLMDTLTFQARYQNE